MIMVGRSDVALRVAPVPPVVDIAPNASEASSGDFAGTFFHRPADLHRYRVVFPGRWSAFLRAHFQGPSHIAFFFSVDDRTARNWWNGVSGPSASAVVLAAAVAPALILHMIGEAAA
jgi:hypothetical protein